MKVKVQEYVETIYELPDNHFDNLIDSDGGGYTMDEMSDCEIAYEFKKYGKQIFQDRSYEENPISWDTRVFNNDTENWEDV